MAKATLYNKSGAKQTTSVTLDKAVFDLVPNNELLTLAYNAYLSNGRSAHPNTLTRGSVRGGGRKPWRQKGTGRARVGSIRVPEWRGGGVVFGPTGLENHTVKLPIKMKRLAIRQALSVQAADGRIAVIESFASVDGKVKPTVTLLAKMETKGKLLLVLDQKNQLAERATRNLSGLTVVAATYLNVFDILNADQIIIDQKALDAIGHWLTTPETAAKTAKSVVETKSPVKAEDSVKTTAEKPKAVRKPATKKKPEATK